jgi:hypothetical protein
VFEIEKKESTCLMTISDFSSKNMPGHTLHVTPKLTIYPCSIDTVISQSTHQQSRRSSNSPTHPYTTTIIPLHSRHTRTITWSRRPSSWHPTTFSPTYICNTTAVRLGDDVNLTSAIRAHVQPTLRIPRQSHRAEAAFRAARKVRVGYDVDGSRGAV